MEKFKLKSWNGELPQHSISIKIDGIQAMLNDEGQVVSRAGKPLYNVDPSLLEPGKKYEIFLGTFKETDSVLSTHNHARKVCKEDVYEIWPDIDFRLTLPLIKGDTIKSITDLFKLVVESGNEGLVFDQKWKMKPCETWDVPITGIVPGKGKHLGRMGALMTTMGKVGTGFTDNQREEIWTIGELIEVECMQLTPDGLFRHPRFVRRRWDKTLTT